MKDFNEIIFPPPTTQTVIRLDQIKDLSKVPSKTSIEGNHPLFSLRKRPEIGLPTFQKPFGNKKNKVGHKKPPIKQKEPRILSNSNNQLNIIDNRRSEDMVIKGDSKISSQNNPFNQV